MKICVVGNGPSAEGHGAEIDACDFVVRLKAYWVFGATDAGSKVDAVAWFGAQRKEWCNLDVGDDIPICEHWRTWCNKQYEESPLEWKKARAFFAYVTCGLPVVSVLECQWMRAIRYLNRHPSAGFVTITMVLDRWPKCELLLTGFDATIPDRPDYYDARRPATGDLSVHDMVAEKRAIAELLEGSWLGEPSQAALTWLNMPELE